MFNTGLTREWHSMKTFPLSSITHREPLLTDHSGAKTELYCVPAGYTCFKIVPESTRLIMQHLFLNLFFF